ncbi:MAG: beta-propeller fold lactonase family protein [Candidatus Marinimicrobia bacterium]|jgi:DNA-binding beta-propeller fold protein YncE|nr:beta-propeller fold lactonase family protein [Candidatus Neomarinimicrobiota bacterium]MBT3936302.1 beta-propeller fold lactonase family protein [Candidatus Neomarinimicrobiota bacterium]MBT3962255.1 beta-propeller fold lactonase family protein [Candidatus Neomarinimicrobiota bacterium]MBT4383342.1 beta-propeller fold lactonase family protein [Candidatus Neomarinimicrobiota bacterium]MBT4635355.1 beta-propeller fold lactonase family protein [Candidatus Neomarinimicrobiota bacterium]
MKKINLIIFPLLLGLSACALFTDNEEPDIYFPYYDFEILKLGKSISDMVISPNGEFLYLADYSNNKIVQINTSSNMSVSNDIVVGSHPTALSLSPNGQTLGIALEGESNIVFMSLNDFSIIANYSISLMNVNDLSFIDSNTIIISSKTDPSCITLKMDTGIEKSESILNGEFAVNMDSSIIYVATHSSIKKYVKSGNNYIQSSTISDAYGFSATINHFVFNASSNSLFLCASNEDEESTVKHVYSYNGDNLTFAGKFLIKSPGLGVSVTQNGEKVFIAPMDADPMGIFVVEFDAETKLEKNYYLSAGNLTRRGILLSPDEKSFYVLVDTPGDNDSFEPYNSNSFDLQRINIIEN